MDKRLNDSATKEHERIEYQVKPSVFNFEYERDNGTYVVFNTFSKAVVEFDNHEKYQEIIRTCCGLNKPAEKESNESLTLKNNGIIVSDGTDELSVLKYFHYKAKFSKEHLILTVAPTLLCNFACPYCYETPHHGFMSETIQSALIDYIRQKIDDGAKDIDLTWYGGEPLLYPQIVDNVSSRIIQLAEEKNVKIHFTMVTNGSLITKDIVAMLEKNRINSIQITLDGLENNHNARRPFRNGGGSYQTNGWHGMYVFSEKETSDRIFPIAVDFELFKRHALQAAKQWTEQRQWLNSDWKTI